MHKDFKISNIYFFRKTAPQQLPHVPFVPPGPPEPMAPIALPDETPPTTPSTSTPETPPTPPFSGVPPRQMIPDKMPADFQLQAEQAAIILHRQIRHSSQVTPAAIAAAAAAVGGDAGAPLHPSQSVPNVMTYLKVRGGNMPILPEAFSKTNSYFNPSVPTYI